MQKQFTTGIVCRFSHHPPPQPRLALVEAGGSSSTGRGSTHAPILGPALYAALSVPDVCASDLGRAKLWPPNVRWRYLHAPTSSERRAVVYRNGGDAFRHYFQLTHLMRAETRRAQQPWMGAHQQSAPEPPEFLVDLLSMHTERGGLLLRDEGAAGIPLQTPFVVFAGAGGGDTLACC